MNNSKLYRFPNAEHICCYKALHDANITDAAYRLLVKVFQFPDEFEFTVSEICQEMHWGTTKTRNALNNLIENGYLTRKTIRNDRGHVVMVSHWFYESPELNPKFKQNGRGSL